MYKPPCSTTDMTTVVAHLQLSPEALSVAACGSCPKKQKLNIKGSAICYTGLVNSYLRLLLVVANKPPRSRHVPQVSSALPGMCWRGTAPSLKLSHGRNGPGLGQISPGTLLHPQNVQIDVANKPLIYMTRVSQTRCLRHRAVVEAHAPDR